jgi:hypothetical protein
MPAHDPQGSGPNPPRPPAGTLPFLDAGSSPGGSAVPAAMGSIADLPPGSLRLISGMVDLTADFHPERRPARGATGDGTTTELRLVLQRLAEVTDKVEHLTRAISRRDVIERAAGMLMERYGLTSEQALELLVATSSAGNSKLAAVAAHLTATGVLEQPPQP